MRTYALTGRHALLWVCKLDPKALRACILAAADVIHVYLSMQALHVDEYLWLILHGEGKLCNGELP